MDGPSRGWNDILDGRAGRIGTRRRLYALNAPEPNNVVNPGNDGTGDDYRQSSPGGNGGLWNDEFVNSYSPNVGYVEEWGGVPGAGLATEDAPFDLGGVIEVSDIDAESGTETMTLSVGNGTRTLASTAGLSFGVGGGTGDASMSFAPGRLPPRFDFI